MIKRGGPQDRRCENFFKLPTGFRPTQWGDYSMWEPKEFVFDRDINAHVDTQIAMEAGCKFYTNPVVGAVLCPSANIPRSALLRITTKNGETLAWGKAGLVDFNECQVYHNEEWTQHTTLVQPGVSPDCAKGSPNAT